MCKTNNHLNKRLNEEHSYGKTYCLKKKNASKRLGKKKAQQARDLWKKKRDKRERQ